MSRIYNIIINQHTKVRMPISDNAVKLTENGYNRDCIKAMGRPVPFTDLTRVAKTYNIVDHYKQEFANAWDISWTKKYHEAINEKFDYNAKELMSAPIPAVKDLPKTPSWWERLRGKR